MSDDIRVRLGHLSGCVPTTCFGYAGVSMLSMKERQMHEFPGIPDAAERGSLCPPGATRDNLTAAGIADAWSSVMDEISDAADRTSIVTLVVNDGTRPPSFPMLKPLEKLLEGRVRVLFATGTHRPVTEAERELLLGGLFPEALWISSDCDSEDMVDLGRTSRGTQFKVHPWVTDGSPVISVNSVEPHYFAGFTGGRKSFLPGVSSRETIVANHYHACEEGSLPGTLDGNPVHLDMLEALDYLEKRTWIRQGNGVMHMGGLVHASAGSCLESFLEAVEVSAALSSITLPRKSKVLVLHPGEPLHVSLYQSEKAIYHCHHLVEDGGILLLVSPCREGLGAGHLEQAFISSMDPLWETPGPAEYRLGDHSIVRLKQMRRRIRIAVASGIPDVLLERMGIEPVHNPVEWLDGLDLGEPLFIPRAGFILPGLPED